MFFICGIETIRNVTQLVKFVPGFVLLRLQHNIGQMKIAESLLKTIVAKDWMEPRYI